MQKLNQIALDIEFLLISVVQGVALAALAQSAGASIGNLQFIYWPYIFSAFLFILIFWSGAIIHAISFVDWPLDLWHSFFYFLASFVEVVSFMHLSDPVQWFGFVVGFMLVAQIVYVVDYVLIKRHKDVFGKSAAQRTLYRHIISRHRFEMLVMAPLGIVLNVISFLLLLFFPDIFIRQGYHFVLILLQIGFGILVLVNSLRNFSQRSFLISRCLKQ